MILPDFKVFPKQGRLLGIDWGAARAGVAISDDSRNFVFTRPAIIHRSSNKESLAKQIADIAASEKVACIVIGLPLRTDGTESETTKAVRKCAEEISSYTDIPIAFIDETLTSLSAQEQIGKAKITEIKEKLDSESAKIILENAIALIKRN